MSDDDGTRMTRTGVYLTEDEISSVKEWMGMPLIAPGGVFPESPRQMVHRIALRKGLPEIPGYYGADLKTGEILQR